MLSQMISFWTTVAPFKICYLDTTTITKTFQFKENYFNKYCSHLQKKPKETV